MGGSCCCSNMLEKLPSKSSLLSLLSLINSEESFGRNPKENIKDHLGNSYNLADVLATNQKEKQNFQVSADVNDTPTIIPTLADVTNIITNLTADVKDGLVLRSKDFGVINSTFDSSSLALATTERSSLQIAVANSARNDLTISTRKPVSLSPAELQQIIDIANNRRQAYPVAGVDSSDDRVAETAMKLMVKNKIGVDDAMLMMAGKPYDPDAVFAKMAENAAAKVMAENKFGGEASMIARDAPGQFVGLVQNDAGEATGKLMAENNLGNKAIVQMMANEAAQGNAKIFRVDNADTQLFEDDKNEKLQADALLKIMARTLPNPVPNTTPALSIAFDDTDSLHTLNDTISESGRIWQTYETAEGTTNKNRKCFQCHPEIKTSYRDPRIYWICGGYNQARRSFKSVCIMHMRNCQDGTMFVKLHDNKCSEDKSDEVMPHGKTFFYEYEAPLSFETDNAAFGDEQPSQEEQVHMHALYDDFKFFGRSGKQRKNKQA